MQQVRTLLGLFILVVLGYRTLCMNTSNSTYGLLLAKLSNFRLTTLFGEQIVTAGKSISHTGWLVESKGTFKNCVDKILHFFCQPLLLCGPFSSARFLSKLEISRTLLPPFCSRTFWMVPKVVKVGWLFHLIQIGTIK